jgi:hypothetical protein
VAEMETLTAVSRQLFFKHGKSSSPYGVTSTGRKLVFQSCSWPKKGDIYLKPTGSKGVYKVLVAQQDFPEESLHDLS